MPQTVLLTGGAGYIGSHTCVALSEAGFDVVILDDFSNAKADVIDRLKTGLGVRSLTCYEGSVLDAALLRKIFANHDISAVVHFAAKKAVGESVDQPLMYFQTNIGGLLTLLDAMDHAQVRSLVFSSSATVYGDTDIIPTPEEAPRSPTSPYGYTKTTSEEILLRLQDSQPWAFGILRYFNPVGAHDSGLIGEDPQGIPNNLMPYIAQVAEGRRSELQVFGNDYPTRDGTGERDYIHVCDLARGHVLSVQKLLETGQGHLVNLGTGQAYSVLEVLAEYSKTVGRDLPYKIVPRRAGDVSAYLADVTKAREVLGFETELGLPEMCQSSWHWMEQQAKR